MNSAHIILKDASSPSTVRLFGISLYRKFMHKPVRFAMVLPLRSLLVICKNKFPMVKTYPIKPGLLTKPIPILLQGRVVALN